jgi:hypothetical protein
MSGISNKSIKNSSPADQPDDEIVLLPGWPGYRTQPGRSGYDYIDTQLEIAHMAGIFLRQLFTNTWRRPGYGPHPLVILIVGIMLWIAFPGNRYTCPGIIGVFFVAIIAAVRNRRSRNKLEENRIAEEDELNGFENNEEEN